MRKCNCEQAQELRKRIEELEAALDTAKVGLRVLAAGGAAGKTDRDYATEVLEAVSEG